MNQLTKEQFNLWTIIESVVLLVCFFLLPGIKASVLGYSFSTPMSKMLFEGGAGIFLSIFLFLALLAPIYLILYSLKDKELLASLKPIFVIDRKVAGILAAVAGIVVWLGFFFTDNASPGFGAYLYFFVAGAVCALGVTNKD